MNVTLISNFQHFAETIQVKCDNAASSYCSGLPQVDAGNDQLQQILQILFGVLAALAVLFIVIGGLRYITSQGNPQETTKARDTILYAIVGLVVAVLAEVIVSFVVGHI